jgi:hypothetical protein
MSLRDRSRIASNAAADAPHWILMAKRNTTTPSSSRTTISLDNIEFCYDSIQNRILTSLHFV